MSDAPEEPNALERIALDAVLRYLDGHASLDAAVIAIRSLVELPPPDSGADDDSADAGAEGVFGLDLTGMPAEWTARYDALNRALREAYPDTA